MTTKARREECRAIAVRIDKELWTHALRYRAENLPLHYLKKELLYLCSLLNLRLPRGDRPIHKRQAEGLLYRYYTARLQAEQTRLALSIELTDDAPAFVVRDALEERGQPIPGFIAVQAQRELAAN